MFRLLLSAIYNTATWFQFLNWAWNQTEGQIDKMQDAAFNTPGAESPVPPSILMAAAGVLAGHFTLSRILRLRRWQSLLSLFLGVAAGAALVLLRPRPAR
jgi:hypothetical protein